MNNAVTLCALLATVVAVAVTAYDFEDPEFNQILARDLEDIYDSYAEYSHPRYRRDEEAAAENKDKCRPWKRRGKLCCAETLMDKIHDENKDTKRNCFKEVIGKDKPEKPPRFDPFKCEDVEKRKKEMTCVMQCAGQKRGVLDADGNPKEEEFGSFVKESFATESWLTSLQDKVISTCLDEARNATANRDASDSESCNPAGAKIAHCLFREIQLNCPAAQIKDEKSCARLRERIKGHDFFPPPPPPGAADEVEN